MEAGGVVPAGGAGLVAFAVALEEHAEGGGAGTEGGRDAGSEAVARGSADHQDRLGSALDRLTGLHVGDLLTDRRGAAVGVGGDADEPADARLQDLLGHADTFGGGGAEFNLELGGKKGARRLTRIAPTFLTFHHLADAGCILMPDFLDCFAPFKWRDWAWP